eukprot:2567954-Pyramimonas_sp.AAC.1
MHGFNLKKHIIDIWAHAPVGSLRLPSSPCQRQHRNALPHPRDIATRHTSSRGLSAGISGPY